MYQIKELLPELLPLLPGCESPVALQAVRAAGREFARESGAYLAAHLEELSESVEAVCVAVPEDAVIFRINRVFCGKRMLAPRSYRLDPANHTRVLLDKPTGQKGEVIRVEYSMLPTPLCNAYAEEFLTGTGRRSRQRRWRSFSPCRRSRGATESCPATTGPPICGSKRRRLKRWSRRESRSISIVR